MGNQEAVPHVPFDELEAKFRDLSIQYNNNLADHDMKKIKINKANESKGMMERKNSKPELESVPVQQPNHDTIDDIDEISMNDSIDEYLLEDEIDSLEDNKNDDEMILSSKDSLEYNDYIDNDMYNNFLQYRKEYEEEVVDIQSKIESGLPEDDQLLKQQLVAERAGHLARANWDYKIKAEYERKITELRKNAIALRKDLVSEEDLPSYSKALDEIEETNRKYVGLQSDYVALEASFKALDTWLNTEKEKIIGQRDADILVFVNQIKEEDNEISNKEQEIKRLNKSLEQSDAANKCLRNEIDYLHSDYASLEALLNESQETVAHPNADILVYKNQIKEKDNYILSKEQEIKYLNESLEQSDAANESLQNEIDGLHSDYVALEALLKESQETVAHPNADILVYKNQIKEKDNYILSKEQEIKYLNESLEQSDAANESLQNEIDGLHSDYVALEALLKESQETVAQRDEEIKNLKQSLVDFENKYNLDMAICEEMNNEKEKACNSKNIINSICVGAKSASNKYSDAENELKNPLNDKQDQIQVLSTEMSGLQAKSVDNERVLNAKTQQLPASNKDYIQQISDLQDKIEEKENMINQLSEDKENAIKRGDGLELALVILRNTIRDLKTEVHQALQTVGIETVFQDDETTDDIKNAVNNTILSYNGRSNDLIEEADKLTQTISDSEKKDDEQRDTINCVNTTKNETAVKISELEDEIENLESEIVDLKKEYDELKASTDAEIARLSDVIASKEDELEKTKKEDADTLNAKINDLSTLLDEFVKCKTDDDFKLHALYQQRIDDFESLIKTSNDEEKMDRLLNAIKKEAGNVKTLGQQVKDLNFQMTEKTWRAQNAQKELEDMKEEMRNKIEQLHSTIKKNQETYEKECQRLEEIIANKDRDINELREEIAELE
ncbi:hypothetical protein WA158_007563 [Blastocystis sp. Blastoise]